MLVGFAASSRTLRQALLFIYKLVVSKLKKPNGIYENLKIPELFISGLPNGLTSELIEKYTEKYRFGNVPLNEKIRDLFEKFPVYFIKVENENLSEYVLSSIKYYENRNYEYLQLIFPDLNGNFPNEPNYDYDQKIVGKIK
jgi:hypothetical protein